MGFRESLDKYLTQEPDYSFENWCELVVDKITNDVYNEWEDLICKFDGQVNDWMWKLFNKPRSIEWSLQYHIEYAARILERALTLYKPKKK